MGVLIKVGLADWMGEEEEEAAGMIMSANHMNESDFI